MSACLGGTETWGGIRRHSLYETPIEFQKTHKLIGSGKSIQEIILK